MPQSIKQFYFVDESGQDPKSEIFIVAVAVMPREHRELENACLGYEKASGKNRKWKNTPKPIRLRFMHLIIEDERFASTLIYTNTRKPKQANFDQLTIEAIAHTIELTRDTTNADSPSSEVYIDGLSPAKKEEYSRALRAKGLKAISLHRATDHANPFIRLADALAGLVRDGLEDPQSEEATLLRRAKRRGVVIDSK